MDSRSANRTILLVEDDPVLAMNTAAQLEKFGYAVLTTLDGEHALEMLAGPQPVDLVLIDLDLGEKCPDGAEVARQMLARRKLPIVFLFGHTGPEVAAKIDKTTSYGYVVKGSGEFVLETSIKMAFQLYQATCLLNEREASLQKALAEQRAAAEALEQKSAELEMFFENAHALLCFADVNGYFRRVNREWARLLGYTSEELNGRRYLDFVHPDDLPATLDVMDRLAGRAPVDSFVNRYRCRDGSYRWIEWRSKPYGELLLSTATDITERKQFELERAQAEEALRASEDRYRALIEISPDPICVTDLDGKILMVNRVTLEEFGFASLEELQASGLTTLDFFVDSDRQRAVENMEKALEQGSLRNVEYRMRRHDGTQKWTEISASVLRDGEGRPVSFICILHDVSDRKRALDEKSTLLRDLQHRIKNSLALITSLVMLEQEHARQPETRKSLNEIYDRVNSLAKLYNILYEAQNIQQVNLAQYLAQVTQSLSGSYRRQGVEIEMAFDPLVIDVHKATPFGLILNELLTNALKYAFPGGRAGKIWISLRLSGERLVLEVCDNGVGLPPENHTQGLGLQLVDLLVSQLSGSLASEGREHTRFVVEVPIITNSG